MKIGDMKHGVFCALIVTFSTGALMAQTQTGEQMYQASCAMP